MDGNCFAHIISLGEIAAEYFHNAEFRYITDCARSSSVGSEVLERCIHSYSARDLARSLNIDSLRKEHPY